MRREEGSDSITLGPCGSRPTLGTVNRRIHIPLHHTVALLYTQVSSPLCRAVVLSCWGVKRGQLPVPRSCGTADGKPIPWRPWDLGAAFPFPPAYLDLAR